VYFLFYCEGKQMWASEKEPVLTWIPNTFQVQLLYFGQSFLLA